MKISHCNLFPILQATFNVLLQMEHYLHTIIIVNNRWIHLSPIHHNFGDNAMKVRDSVLQISDML